MGDALRLQNFVDGQWRDAADIATAAETIAAAGYFDAGQDGPAATRVPVAEGVHGDLVAALPEPARAVRTGRPDDPDVLYGPLDNRVQLGRVAHIPLVAEMPHGGFTQPGSGKDLSGHGFEDHTRVEHVMANIDS